MPEPNTDRNLLFGIIALQMDFISRESLIQAMSDWATKKSHPLGEILVNNQALNANDRDLLEQMVDRHVELHEGAPDKSLAALSTLGAVTDALGQIEETDIQEAMTILSTVPGKDADSSSTSHGLGEDSAIGARFRILRPHAEGGLGRVSAALDRELHREVALKEIKPAFADELDSRERFILEAEITGGLEHPGIVPVYALGRDESGRPFYAMRFIKGQSLREAINQYHRKAPELSSVERTLEQRKLLSRFVDVCNAIEYAHSRGVLHRDIKPSNVMVGKYGETLVVDWGLAKVIGRDESSKGTGELTLRPNSASGSAPTQLGNAIGTPAYMSPEQAAGRIEELGPTTDVYSLGATLYCLLTNQAPFTDDNVELVIAKVQMGECVPARVVNADVPPALNAICLKAMSVDASSRYASPRELAEDLELFMADEPTAALSESYVTQARRWIRKRPRTVATIVATALCGMILAAIVAMVTENKNRELAASYRVQRDALLEAQRQRSAAERAKEQALRSLDITLTAIAGLGEVLGQDDLLQRPALLGLRKQLADIPISAYRALQQEMIQTGESTSLDPGTAHVARDLMLVLAAIGEKEEAENVFNQSRSLLESRLEGSSANQSVADELFDLACIYGGAFSVLEPLEYAEQITEVYGEDTGDEQTWRYNRASLHEAMGSYYTTQLDFENAAFHYDLAMASYRELGDAQPASQNLAMSAAGAFNQTGRHEEAVALMNQAISWIQSNIETNDDDVTKYRRLLAKAYSNMAGIHFGRDNLAASQWLNKAIQLTTALAVEYPTSPLYHKLQCDNLKNQRFLDGSEQSDQAFLREKQFLFHLFWLLLLEPEQYRSHVEMQAWAVSAMQLPSIEACDDVASAESLCDELCRHWNSLIFMEPHQTHWQLGLGAWYSQCGVALRSKSPEVALRWLTRGATLLERLTENDRESRVLMHYLQNTYAARTDVLMAMGRSEEALVEWDRVIALDDALDAPPATRVERQTERDSIMDVIKRKPRKVDRPDEGLNPPRPRIGTVDR